MTPTTRTSVMSIVSWMSLNAWRMFTERSWRMHEVHRRRQLRLERRQHGANGVGDLDHVGARLLLHFERDGALLRVLRDVPRPLRARLDAVEHVGDLVEPHRPAVAVRHDDLPEFVGVVQLPLRQDAVGGRRPEQLAGRLRHVPVLQRRVDFVDADLLRFELVGIDLDAHRVLGARPAR